MPGEHTAPCPACDNLCFKELASNTLFAWEHVGTANCWWAAPACGAPATPCSCQCSPCTLVLPFPCTFPCSPRDSRAHSMDSRAHWQSSASRFHRKPGKIVQNYNENNDAVLTVHGKTFIPQKLSTEPVKTKTNTLGYATSIISPFNFFFVLYKWSCFVLSLIQSPQKLMKTFPIAFQGFGPGPWWGWTHALVTVYIHIAIKYNKTKPMRTNSMSFLYIWILIITLKLKGCAFPCYKNSSGGKVKICSTCPEPTCFCCHHQPGMDRGCCSSHHHPPRLLFLGGYIKIHTQLHSWLGALLKHTGCLANGPV